MIRFMLTLIIAIVLLIGGHSNPANAQGQTLAPNRSAMDNKLLPLLKQVTDDPQNPDLHLKIADLYCGKGSAAECAEHALKVIELRPGSDKARRAYHLCMIGYYSAGEMQNSWDIVNRALEQDPDNEMSKSFKAMLEAAKENFWKGTLPKKLSWYGYDTTNQFLAAVRKSAAGMATIGAEPDCILNYVGRQICWTGIEGWRAVQNVELREDIRALLLYMRDPGRMLPSIGITADFVPREITIPADFSRRIKASFEQQEGVTVDDPELLDVNGYAASRLQMKLPNGIRSVWYQFLFDRQIVSVQMMTTVDEYDEHLEILKTFVESIKAGDSIGSVGSFKPPSVE